MDESLDTQLDEHRGCYLAFWRVLVWYLVASGLVANLALVIYLVERWLPH